jgi:N-acetylneuraminate synthase
MKSAFVIAEAGVNHNGSLDIAFQLIDAAKEAGADAVKFQTFTTAGVVVKSASKAEYQKKATGADESQYDMIKKLELDAKAHEKLVARCKQVGIPFLSTPFDLPSLALLLDLGVPRLKIASGEITNLRLMKKAASSGLPIILSTGMSTLGDVEAALGVLASGYLQKLGKNVAPAEALLHGEGQAEVAQKVTLLHCVTEYPAPYADVNLRAMETMHRAFGLPVGYSDHTLDIYVCIGAVALGASVIEKHFTMDRKLPGPDHSASLEPSQLKEMIKGIRAVEASLGTSRKAPAASELKNRDIARRSLVAASAIKKGEAFTADNLTAKRPGTGISAMRIDEWVGKVATRDYAADELIEP